MKGWKAVRLGELLTIKHGFAFRGEYFSDEGEHVLLTPGNFAANGGLKLGPAARRYYVGPVPPGFVLQAGDLVVVMTDLKQDAPILGSSGLVPEGISLLHNQRIGLVEWRKPEEIDHRFVHYLTCTPGYRDAVKASATGSTVRHTAPTRIESIVVALPPLEVQRRIAAVLNSFDELIENNRRRIEVLENAARLAGHEWVRNARLDSDHRTVSFGELCFSVTASVDPQSLEPGTPAVGLEHLPRRSTTLTEWTNAAALGSRKLRFEAGDVLFGKIRPYFHKVVVAPISGICSTDAIVLRTANPSLAGVLVATASSDEFVAHAVRTSNGTKMPRADWKVLSRYPVVLAGDRSTQEFSDRVMALVQTASNLGLQNRMLSVARDLLLPRLVTGRLDVSALAVDEVYGWAEIAESTNREVPG